MLSLFLLYCFSSNVVLNNKNFVEINGEIENEIINNAIREITYSRTYPFYLYINTNGGDVDAGLRLIHTLQTNPNVVCIGENIISMGFSIFQACPKRLILSSSTAMQHQLIVSLSGPLYTLLSKIKYLKNVDEHLIAMESSRLKIGKNKFKSLIQHEWWLYGEEIINNNVADNLTRVICSKNIIREKCPLYT